MLNKFDLINDQKMHCINSMRKYFFEKKKILNESNDGDW